MLSKSKRLVIILFGVLFIDDICRMIKAFVTTKGASYESFNFFFSMVDGRAVAHLSLIYALIVLVIYFATHFFKNEN